MRDGLNVGGPTSGAPLGFHKTLDPHITMASENSHPIASLTVILIKIDGFSRDSSELNRNTLFLCVQDTV